MSGKSVVGGLIVELIGFANFKRYFPIESHLIYIYRDSRPYKRDLISLCPYINRAVDIGSDVLPTDAISRQAAKSARNKGQATPMTEMAIETGICDTDLMLSLNVRHACYFNFKPHARFRIPKKREHELARQLIERGVDPNRFVVTFHARESGYAFRESLKTNIRSVDPMKYFAVMKHVIEQQGGQVVRIGDPSMTKLPDLPGLIDLSREEGVLMLQAFAISRSRYAVCSDSGVLPLACAFQVPLAAADVTNPMAFPMHPEHVIITKTYLGPDGNEWQQGDAYYNGVMRHKADVLNPGFSVRECSIEQLRTAADRLYSQTRGVEGWRDVEDEPVHAPRADFFETLQRSTPKYRQDLTFL